MLWKTYDGVLSRSVLLREDGVLIGLVIRAPLAWGWLACVCDRIDGYYKTEEAAKAAVEKMVL